MKLRELFESENINDVNYDPIAGIGAVGYNANVDYRGLKVMMKPSVFLQLAKHVSDSHLKSVSYLEKEIQQGSPIGPAYLELNLDDDRAGNPTGIGAKVIGHEGRNRAYVIKKLHGDSPMLVHLFFTGLRARHITPEIVAQINRELVNQDGNVVKGPLFDRY